MKIFMNGLESDSEISEKAKVRVLFTGTGKNTLQNFFKLMKICIVIKAMYCYYLNIFYKFQLLFSVRLDSCQVQHFCSKLRLFDNLIIPSRCTLSNQNRTRNILYWCIIFYCFVSLLLLNSVIYLFEGNQ